MTEVKVALLSDTHGHLDARIAEIVSGCDHAVHAGDIGNRAVLAALRPRQTLISVLGNNDTPRQWDAAEMDVLAQLPETASLELPGGLLVVEHGHRTQPASRQHALLRAKYPQARAVVYGHTHKLVCDRDHPTWVLNPGAAGRTRTYGGPSCLVLTAGAQAWFVQEYRFTL